MCSPLEPRKSQTLRLYLHFHSPAPLPTPSYSFHGNSWSQPLQWESSWGMNRAKQLKQHSLAGGWGGLGEVFSRQSPSDVSVTAYVYEKTASSDRVFAKGNKTGFCGVSAHPVRDRSLLAAAEKNSMKSLASNRMSFFPTHQRSSYFLSWKEGPLKTFGVTVALSYRSIRRSKRSSMMPLWFHS